MPTKPACFRSINLQSLKVKVAGTFAPHSFLTFIDGVSQQTCTKEIHYKKFYNKLRHAVLLSVKVDGIHEYFVC